MNIEVANELQITDSEGKLLLRPTIELSVEEAQAMRRAAKLLRSRRFRMTIRCDACFEANRGDGMRGEINSQHIFLECRCRILKFSGQTL